MKDLFERIQKLTILLTLGVLGEALFTLFIIFKRIEIKGNFSKERLRPSKEGLIVVYNHPSLWEPGLLPFLFVLHFLFSFSFKFVPYSTPDKTNFFDKYWFWPIRLFCIPINREEKTAKDLRRLIKLINEGKIVIIAPEGGRTYKGEEFKILKNDSEIIIKRKNEITPQEQNLPKIRRFQRGFEAVLKFTKAPILLIWTEGGDKVIPNQEHFPKGPYFLLPNLKEKTIIKIGKKIKIKNIEELENELLKLAVS